MRAVESQLHGALIDVLGLGVLLRGPSGIGKSECALELVSRGNRLVADDVVLLRRNESGRLVGTAPKLIRHYLEIRGIGLLYVPDLFGEQSVCEEAEVSLLCNLEQWREDAVYDRVGLERSIQEIAGVQIPSLVLPVRPAASLATLVEVAARDQRLRVRGENAAERLDARLRGQWRHA